MANELIHQHGGFVSTLPLAELKKRGHVNPIAERIGNAADFSKRIREGVPGFEGG